jgi:hypothetical protein
VTVVNGDKGTGVGLSACDLADALHPALVAEALVPASSATPALLISDLMDLIR